MIAVTHPGKLGDALYALPALRALCARHGCQADFWTSAQCAALGPLLSIQPEIRNVRISGTYRPTGFDCGGQPPVVPTTGEEGDEGPGYEAVYHLGYRSVPNCPLPLFMARQAGLADHEIGPVRYATDPGAPGPRHRFFGKPYVVLAARGETTHKERFREFAAASPFAVVEVGGHGEAVAGDHGAEDLCGLPFDQMASVIAASSGFVGLMSAPLAVAQGFPVPKLVVHDGRSWDMGHALVNDWTHYRADPDHEELADHLRGLDPLSRSLHPLDYRRLCHDSPVVSLARRLLEGAGVPCLFQHHHRQWEYSICLQACRLAFVGDRAWPCPESAPLRGRRILDVGGAWSPLAASLALLGAEVFVLDPAADAGTAGRHGLAVGAPGLVRSLPQRVEEMGLSCAYDAVLCVSTVEHLDDRDGNDEEQARRMARCVRKGGVLVLTTDFHPSGKAFTQGHLRTYGADGMMRLAHAVEKVPGMLCCDNPDWRYKGDHVGPYSFASLVATRA